MESDIHSDKNTEHLSGLSIRSCNGAQMKSCTRSVSEPSERYSHHTPRCPFLSSALSQQSRDGKKNHRLDRQVSPTSASPCFLSLRGATTTRPGRNGAIPLPSVLVCVFSAQMQCRHVTLLSQAPFVTAGRCSTSYIVRYRERLLPACCAPQMGCTQ